jgi:hypothetical protein
MDLRSKTLRILQFAIVVVAGGPIVVKKYTIEPVSQPSKRRGGRVSQTHRTDNKLL